ncbi:MAG: YdbC family protein [Anaerotignaceae bacterium]
MADIKFEIIKPLGVLSSSENSSKELNLVKWGSGEPKYDIRAWQDDHKKPLKGITLNKDELAALINAGDLALKGGAEDGQMG